MNFHNNCKVKNGHKPVNNYNISVSLKIKNTNEKSKKNNKLRISKHLIHILKNKSSQGSSISDQILINRLQSIAILPNESLNQYLTQSMTVKQKQALDYISEKAKRESENALLEISNLMTRIKRLNISKEDILKTLRYIEFEAPLIIRINAPALKLIADDTHYRNQFETHTSNGALDNISRKHWENKMFNNIYNSAIPFDRCKYGSIDVYYNNNQPRHYPRARAYGLSYFVLKPHMRSRVTCCYGDSGGHVMSDGIMKFGTLKYFAHILEQFCDDELINIVSFVCGIPCKPQRESNYKELQIHGPVVVDTDIESLVISASDQLLLPKETIDKFERRGRAPLELTRKGIKIVYSNIEYIGY